MLVGPDLSQLEPPVQGSRAEQPPARNSLLDRLGRHFSGWFLPAKRLIDLTAAKHFVYRVNSFSDAMSACNQAQLDQMVKEIRFQLRKQGLKSVLVARAFAMIREIACRELGQRHYDTQLCGGWLLLRGMVAEMPTGEGKTLTATLAAGTAAMAGLPVQVLTVNDYLTERDAREMTPVYHALGLSIGTIIHSVERDERVRMYAKDVVYCTGKEVVFDYLRDRIELGTRRLPLHQKVEPIFGSMGRHHRLITRGLHFAIVDEADSVLIDEARTPLIISSAEGSQYQQDFLKQALRVAEKLEKDRDFKLDESRRTVELLEEGMAHIKYLGTELGPLWSGKIRREEVVSQALTALYLFHRDKHYLVRDDKVEIIDQLSGRIAEGRSWERGLHQLIELKENVSVTQQQSTLARISYQSFFQRYLHLSGMTGTAKEVAGELWQVYHLPVTPVPPNRPCQRRYMKTVICTGGESKWARIAGRTQQLVAEGRAVLLGTSSVAESEKAAQHFEQLGLSYNLLNARQDREEAEVIARAGEPCAITIATSMAGRGTDIKLVDIVKQQGGLHVILSERFDAARVDRQLAGRCARQGDPGSFEAILSLEDTSYGSHFSLVLNSAARLLGVEHGLGRLLAILAIRLEQKYLERKSFKERAATRKSDRQQDELLSISGYSE